MTSEFENFRSRLHESIGIGIAGTALLCMYWIAKSKFSEVPDALLLGTLLTIGAAPLVWLVGLRKPSLADTPPLRVSLLIAMSILWLVPWVVLVTLVR